MTPQEIVSLELEKVANQVKESLVEVRKVALSEAWKILNKLTNSCVYIMQIFGRDVAKTERKEIVLKVVSNFYDGVFKVVDVPFIPPILESVLHSYVKKIVMIFVAASIDAAVDTFKDLGIFSKDGTVNSLLTNQG